MLKFQDNNTTVIATFEDFILTTYVIIDELYHQFAPPEVTSRRHILDAKLSDSEIITISLCGELAGVDSENAWFSFVKRNYRHLFPQLCSRSRFNRTRRALIQTTELLRQKMFSVFPVPVSSYYIIDYKIHQLRINFRFYLLPIRLYILRPENVPRNEVSIYILLKLF